MSSNTKFSAIPGAYERHMQRKYNNPLFPEPEQHRMTAEIEMARRKDQQDLQGFFAAFEQAVQQAAKMTGSVDAEIILELKQELERLYVHSCSLAGDLQQHRQAILKLLQVCMATIEKGATDDAVALQKLRDENTARQVFFKLLETRLVADLIRGDEIIKADELIPTLLSESPQLLPNVLELFDSDQISEIHAHARAFVSVLPEEIIQASGCHTQLDIIESGC